nr:MAG TPA: hypothetical protein [Caudoviricetes sp.]
MTGIWSFCVHNSGFDSPQLHHVKPKPAVDKTAGFGCVSIDFLISYDF